MSSPSLSLFFFFNDTATTEIYTLSLHDALPISNSRLSEFRFTARHSRISLGLEGKIHDWKAAGYYEMDFEGAAPTATEVQRSEEHTSELQSPCNLVCRLLLEKKNSVCLSFVLEI